MAEYDLVVIGSGPGGYIAAIRAGQLGMKVACVEKRATLGGTCLNVGCIPSKALLQSSEHYSHIKKLDKHGIKVDGVSLDLGTMLKRKDAVVRQLTNGIAGLFKKNKVEWVKGTAKVKSTTEVDVEVDGKTETLKTKRILLASGSEPTPLPFLPFDGEKVVGSTEALSFPEVPNKLLVVGGGIIGLELGSVWSRLGSAVTVVEFMDRLIPTMDTDLAKETQKILSRQGLKFKLKTKVVDAKVNKSGVKLEVDGPDGKETLEGDIVLVAIGRRPYSEGLGIDELGVEKDDRNRVKVDENYQTNVKGIYAIGDLIAGPMLAHKAEEEGVTVVEKMAGEASHLMYEAIPGIVYTWPEIASVGATEDELKEKGVAYKVGKVPFMANPRAKCADENDGFCKVLADKKTDKLLGVHIIGPQASELIQEAVTIMEFGGSAEDMGRIVHGHPTLSEIMKESALAVDKKSLNF